MYDMKKLFVWTTVGALITLSATSASAFGFGKNKFEKEVEKEQAAVKLARETVQGGYDLITTAELKKLMDSEDILIIDTMPYKDSYQKNHIPGAKQFLFPIPLMESWDSKETANKSQDDYVALLGPDKNKTVVVYCGFVKCTRSHNGALWAKKLGYSKVFRYPGGIFAWKGTDYPTDSAK